MALIDVKIIFFLFFIALFLIDSRADHTESDDNFSDLNLWIGEEQVRQFTDTPMKVYAITDGRVAQYLTDISFSNNLPIIPDEVESVNFTWRSGHNVNNYRFDELISFDKKILHDPTVSIDLRGRIPSQASTFQIILSCVKNATGIASLAISLTIADIDGQFLPDTPIRFKLRKQCQTSPQIGHQSSHGGCLNGGHNINGKCQCQRGWVGSFCQSAICYPSCLNGGQCIAPGVCQCVNGFIGPLCEGGICQERCLNGGKCNQKDKCTCGRGYYGPKCEYSKCVIPCLNGGRCIGIDKCRCKRGYYGSQCESFNKRILAIINRRNKKKQREKFI